MTETTLNQQRNPRTAHLRPWKPGQSGNPAGKPRGATHGRARALAALDAALSEPGTLAHLRAALQKYFNENPIQAFKTIVMPLLPRELLAGLDVDETGELKIFWQPLTAPHGTTIEGDPNQ